jgi:hypothetical protein
MKTKILLFFVTYLIIDILVTWFYQINSSLSWSSQILYERGAIYTFLIVATPFLIIHFKRHGWKPSYLN